MLYGVGIVVVVLTFPCVSLRYRKHHGGGVGWELLTFLILGQRGPPGEGLGAAGSSSFKYFW